MKKIFLIAVFGVLCSSFVLAQSETVLSSTGIATRLNSNLAGINFGYVKVGSQEVANLAWHPDFKYGPWGLGADINIGSGDNKPANYDNLVLRYLEYNDGKKGLRYGVIDYLTWGHGMLVDGYSTRLTGQILLNNQQQAWLGYYDADAYVGRLLSTRTGVNGVRVEERINPMITLGQTYIYDGDGVVTSTGVNQKVSGVGVDAVSPLPLNFQAYAEYAQLMNYGGGLAAGISWGQDFMVGVANLDISLRSMDNKFAPGYFNAQYETDPINLASVEAAGAKNGVTAQFGAKALDMASLNVKYEKYNGSVGALSADLIAKLPGGLDVTGYLTQPSLSSFRSLSFENGVIVGGSLAYPLNTFTKLVVNYKKAWDATAGRVVESQYYEFRMTI